ncbi:MAG TPA: hypothetical protein VIS99_12820 [Terrimicrobiaceae bacterium]
MKLILILSALGWSCVMAEERIPEALRAKASEILQQMSAMGNQILDVSMVIRFEMDRHYQRLAALALLDNYVRYGEPILARHILYQLAESHPAELKDAVRQRLSVGRAAFWDASLRIEGQHFLARDGDRESFEALLEVLEESGSAIASVSAMTDPNAVLETCDSSQDVLAQRALRFFRDADTSRWPSEVWIKTVIAMRKPRARAESDNQSFYASLLSAQSNVESTRYDAPRWYLSELIKNVSGEVQTRALLEQAIISAQEPYFPPQLTQFKPPPPERKLADQTREMFLDLSCNGSYDERMLAVEALALNKDEISESTFQKMADSKDWNLRMASACWLVWTKNTAEAKLRIVKERHPLVQVTLLCALVQS